MSDNEIARTLGRRQPPILALPGAPSERQRAWVRRMARYRTRVPKGVFRYESMEEANADWERWNAAMVAATVSSE